MSRKTKDNDVSELQAEDDVIKNAVTNAVNSCIEKGIMKGYLEEHTEEVIETLMLQWGLIEPVGKLKIDFKAFILLR